MKNYESNVRFENNNEHCIQHLLNSYIFLFDISPKFNESPSYITFCFNTVKNLNAKF